MNHYLIVTDYLPADGKTDAADAIQKLINENPHRTLFFPDGEYLLSHPICTPADPKISVDLRLSNFAQLIASDEWDSEEAMVRLGGIHPFNDIGTPGSNYGITGGIINGSGRAKGISIDSGRETRIADVSLKNTTVGIHIKYGANSASSDADVLNVNIVGNGSADSIGVLLEGFDNTLTNMRIANVNTGLDIRSCGNSFRNLHPLCYYHNAEDFARSCGFLDRAGSNWYNFCYSDHFATGFHTAPGVVNIYDSCFCMWYASHGSCHTAFRAEGAFHSMVTNLKIGFRGDMPANVVLSCDEAGGRGVFHNLSANPAFITDKTYLEYLEGKHF